MKLLTISILLFIFSFTAYGQVKVNPNGKLFDYNGTKIYYEDTGTGEPLLLLHNFFSTANSWKPYVEAYSKQFRTIAVDMMGHGRSDIYKKDDEFRHGDYATIIIALLDSLKLDKLNAIGGSSGGTTLLHLNTMQPDRFKSVITIGGHIYYSKYCRDWIAKQGLDGIMGRARSHGPEKQEYLAKAFWANRKLADGDPFFTPDKLNTIRAKWLVVNGDNDEPVPVQLALEMHKSIPYSRLWIVPNGGHLPYLDADFRAEFLRVSVNFLNGKWDRKD